MATGSSNLSHCQAAAFSEIDPGAAIGAGKLAALLMQPGLCCLTATEEKTSPVTRFAGLILLWVNRLALLTEAEQGFSVYRVM